MQKKRKPGRPPKQTTASESVMMRVSSAFKDKITAEADRRGQTLTVFITRCIQKELGELPKDAM